MNSHDNRNNSLNFIRLLAAFQVFSGHADTHLNLNLPDSVLNIFNTLQGVPIFFLISGFLIWASLEKTNDFRTFAKKRILRLYPELWGGVLLSVTSLLVLYRENIVLKPFIAWIFAQSTVLQFWTPDCLREFGCGTPNGSLWTIGVMVQSYIVIWWLHRFLHKSSYRRWGIIIIAGAGINMLMSMLESYLPAILYKLLTQTFVPYIWIFIIGAFINEYFDVLHGYLKKYWLPAFVFSIIVNCSGMDIGAYGTLKVLFLGPAVIGFAYKYKAFDIKHDISYGFYIYHMIVINIMIEKGMVGHFSDLLFAFTVAVIIAVISYGSIGNLSRTMRKNIG